MFTLVSQCVCLEGSTGVKYNKRQALNTLEESICIYMCQSVIIFACMVKTNSLAQFSFLPLHLLFGGTLRHVRGWKRGFFPFSYDSSTIFKEGFIQTCHLIISKRKSSISSLQRWMYLKHRWAKWSLKVRWSLKVQVRWQGVDYNSSLLTHKPLHSSVFPCSLLPSSL